MPNGIIKKCDLFIGMGYNLNIILKNELETITNIKYNKFKKDWDKSMLWECSETIN